MVRYKKVIISNTCPQKKQIFKTDRNYKLESKTMGKLVKYLDQVHVLLD